MRITLTNDGGLAFLPGLAGPATIDADALPEAERDELRRRVLAARFFERPEVATPRRGADRRTYVLTIADDGRERTLHVGEPADDVTLRDLLTHVRVLAIKER